MFLGVCCCCQYPKKESNVLLWQLLFQLVVLRQRQDTIGQKNHTAIHSFLAFITWKKEHKKNDLVLMSKMPPTNKLNLQITMVTE